MTSECVCGSTVFGFSGEVVGVVWALLPERVIFVALGQECPSYVVGLKTGQLSRSPNSVDGHHKRSSPQADLIGL